MVVTVLLMFVQLKLVRYFCA